MSYELKRDFQQVLSSQMVCSLLVTVVVWFDCVIFWNSSSSFNISKFL